MIVMAMRILIIGMMTMSMTMITMTMITEFFRPARNDWNWFASTCSSCHIFLPRVTTLLRISSSTTLMMMMTTATMKATKTELLIECFLAKKVGSAL